MTYQETMYLIQQLKKENKDLKSENELLGAMLAGKEKELEPLYSCYYESGCNRKTDITRRGLMNWAVRHINKAYKSKKLRG